MIIDDDPFEPFHPFDGDIGFDNDEDWLGEPAEDDFEDEDDEDFFISRPEDEEEEFYPEEPESPTGREEWEDCC